jgi:DNA-directed RNA polymerase subunit H (RpoH/RPB5)
MSNISLNNKIYKSRGVILDQLRLRGFDVSEYENFSLNEIHVLNQANQLDMYLSTDEEDSSKKRRCYVKYQLSGKLTKSLIADYIEDLYNIESMLDENDQLIIILKDKVNTTTRNIISNIYLKEKRFLSVYNINRFLFNILDHSMVPTHIPIPLEEKEKLEKEYNIMSQNQWPEISRFDPVALAIGLRPDQLCKIYRKSPTSSISLYYRLCV